MRLLPEVKTTLIQNAKKVFEAYLALDLFKTYSIQKDPKSTLLDDCNHLISQGNLPATLYYPNPDQATHTMLIESIPDNPSRYRIKIDRIEGQALNDTFKPWKEYQNLEDLLDLLSQQEFYLEQVGKKLVLENTLKSHEFDENQRCYQIGGPGKLDLYRTHLCTLYNIIMKLQNEEDVGHLLVALATGSGKTFVQALWIMVLQLANKRGIFAIPDNLISQFKSDLRKLLPDSLVNDISEVHQDLNIELQTHNILITPSEWLLDEGYQELNEVNPQELFLSFDEQHLLMKAERRRVRLKDLSERMLTMFLSATLNEETYELAGRKPVAMMSSGQKQESGQGLFPEIISMETESLDDKNRFNTYKFWTREFWRTIYRSIMLNLFKSIEIERNSVGISIVEDLPYVIHQKEDEDKSRWRLQVPMARKMLFIVDDNETLVNLAKTLTNPRHYDYQLIEKPLLIESQIRSNEIYLYKDKVHNSLGFQGRTASGEVIQDRIDEIHINEENLTSEFVLNHYTEIKKQLLARQVVQSESKTIYQDGNLRDRNTVAELFETKNVDIDIEREDKSRKITEYRKQFSNEDKDKGIEISTYSLQDQLRYNMFHALIEYALSSITDLDSIAMNQLRKDNPEALLELVKEGLIQKNELFNNPNFYCDQLAELIDPEDAKTLNFVLVKIQQQITALVNNPEKRKAMQCIDNWNLDYQLVHQIQNQDVLLRQSFDKYAQSHLMLSVIKGMNEAETPIQESQPFWGFNSETYNLYDEKGLLTDKAKKREHTSTETLNSNSKETCFTPNYAELTEEQADNYFRLGFIGIYVSNKKTEGFSDKNLHTVVNLAQDKLNSTNSPNELIQGIGRNRGLDETQLPFYIHVKGTQQEATFDLSHLKKDDYYPDLFKAQRAYNEEFITILGQRVAKEIISWYEKNQTPDETIDAELFRTEVLKIVAHALRDINNKNNHQIELSREQLQQIIDIARNELTTKIEQLEKPYKLNSFVRILGSVMNFISGVYYSFLQIPTQIALIRYRWSKRAEAHSEAEELYLNIVEHQDYKTIIKNINLSKEFSSWFTRVHQSIAHQLKTHADDYLTEEVKKSLDEQKLKGLLPILLLSVKPEKRDKVEQAFKDFNSLLSLFQEHLPQLESLAQPDCPNYKENMLDILRCIPGLKHLVLEDIIDFRSQVKKRLEDLAYPIQTIRANEHLRAEIHDPLVELLQGDILQLARALFQPKDWDILKNALTKEKASLFINRLLSNELDLTHINPDECFALLTQTLELDLIKNLKERTKEQVSNFQAIKTQFTQEFEQHVVQLSEPIFRERILSVLINYYPLNQRAQLWQAASPEQISCFLEEHSELLKDSFNSPPDVLADMIFAYLCAKQNIPLPQQINPEEVILIAKEKLEQKANALQQPQHVVFWGVSRLFNSDKTAYPVNEISKLLLTQEFYDVTSLMLPYPQWRQFKQKLEADVGFRKQLAGLLFKETTSSKDKKGSAIDDRKLLELINQSSNIQFQHAEDAAKEGIQELQDLVENVSKRPQEFLREDHKIMLANAAKINLLPLLSVFLDDNEFQRQFINIELAPELMVQYLFDNQELFKQLALAPSIALQKPIASALIEQLMIKAGIEFEAIHCINPEIQAETHLTQIQEAIKKCLLETFLSSNYFAETISLFFNSKSAEQINGQLKHEEARKELLLDLMDENLQNMSADQFKSILRKQPGLNLIETLDIELDRFTKCLIEIGAQPVGHFKKDKLADLFLNSLTPVIFHPEFSKTLQELLGYLSTDELKSLLQAMDVEEPETDAQHLSLFLSLLAKKDTVELKQQFLTLNEEQNTVEELEFIRTIKLIYELSSEILHCHCYFNSQNLRGKEITDEMNLPKPKLYNLLSAELKQIRVATPQTSMSITSRKIPFLQGIREALPLMSAVSAASHHGMIQDLKRVRDNLLSPMQLQLNFSDWEENTVKRIHRLLASGTQHESVDVALNFANKMNELQPFDIDRAKDPSCPIDTIVPLEDALDPIWINQGRFFNQIIFPENLDEMNLLDNLPNP